MKFNRKSVNAPSHIVLNCAKSISQSGYRANVSLSFRKAIALTFATAASMGLTIAVSNSAYATTFKVDSASDESDANLNDGICAAKSANGCTLRAAIEQSNAITGYPPPEITLPAGLYKLELGDLEIRRSLFIKGEKPTTTIIDGNSKSRAFTIIKPETEPSGPIANISYVTVQNGLDPGPTGTAGAILVYKGASLVLRNSFIYNNKANTTGGAIRNAGFMQIFDSSIKDNEITGSVNGGGLTASGGGIYNQGSLEIHRSTISGNQATRGGGISNIGSRLEITNSTIHENRATTRGGAIYNSGTFDYPSNKLENYGTVNISFSTITKNEANYVQKLGTYALEDTFGGGIYNSPGGMVSLGNSILAGNTDQRSRSDQKFSPDCYSKSASSSGISDRYFTSYRSNLVGVLNSNCDFKDSTWGDTRFDTVGTPESPIDPKLNVVSWGVSGNPTVAFYPLVSDSPAIDKGDGITSATFFDCPTTDQRGAPRPVDGNGDGTSVCDIGAYEIAAPEPVENNDNTSCLSEHLTKALVPCNYNSLPFAYPTYDPSAYRPGTSGWTGKIAKTAFYNGSSSAVTVSLYHPDAPSYVFNTWKVEPGQNLFLGTDYYGMDWGIQVNNSPVFILGRVSAWNQFNNENIFQTGYPFWLHN